MAPVVVDASILVRWVLPEPDRAAALQLLRQSVTGEATLIAPALVMAEASSALSRRFRRKQLTEEEARTAYQYLQRRRPTLVEDAKLLDDAMELSLRHQLSLWDCVYLALAIRWRANLATADARFHRSVSRHYPFVELIK
jgi:predicted nucleic acid-binding protein